MNRRNQTVIFLLKKGMPLCMAALIVTLLLQFGLPFISRLPLSHISGLIRREVPSLLTVVWREQYPTRAAHKTDSTGAGLLSLILKQLPVYRYETRRDTVGKGGETDPAFQTYMDSQTFYKEYEYLLREMGHDGEENENSHPDMAAEEIKTTDVVQEQIQLTSSPVLLPSETSLPVVGKSYVMEQLADYDFLMKHFYIVHASTTAGRDMMKAETFLEKDFGLEKKAQPQILIYHTHSQEEYADYGSGNQDATIVTVGERLAELLRAKGYEVLHDTSVYDLHNGELDRNKAYSYALDGITAILQENPSIEVVLDVHRDGVKPEVRLVSDVNGKNTAQIMFFNGMSQTPEGQIEYLQNPYREDNLAFSFQMQLYAEAYFPGYSRRIYLKGLRYNLHLRPRSALIEVGAQTNTLEEALNAMEPLAELLDMVLQTK